MQSTADTIKATAADWIARRDAGLSQSESAKLQTWLDADPRHREALAACESAWGALDRPFQAGAADDLLQAVQARIRRQRSKRIASVVAGLTVLLVAGFAWRTAISSRSNPAMELRGPGVVKLIEPTRNYLPDGSTVELKAGTKFTTDFSARIRRVVLQEGEAHFQVTKDPSRAFVVVVGDVEVRAVGTTFSVQRGSTN